MSPSSRGRGRQPADPVDGVRRRHRRRERSKARHKRVTRIVLALAIGLLLVLAGGGFTGAAV